ncbi:MAG: TatD family hydrolase [Acidobacteriota bacterium]
MTFSSGGREAGWTDSHCHLAMEEFHEDLDAVMMRAREAGVTRLVCISTEPEDWEATLAFARFPFIRVTAGIHPHEAVKFDAPAGAKLSALAASGKVSAVGEIGLDYHYDFSPRAAQRKAFAEQLELAREAGLAVVVHSREAYADTVDLLRAAGPGLRGVIHCYTYGPGEARAFLDLGFHISFSGICTFRNAPEIREAAALVPAGRILVETDAPYLAPVPHRGRRCEPAYAAVTGRFLADLLNRAPDDFAEETTRNAAELFGF